MTSTVTSKKVKFSRRSTPGFLEAAVDRDRAVIESQKADLNRIEALLQQAKNNEARARNLRAINKDYISETDLDQFQFTRMSYEAQIKLSLATIRQVEANLKNSEANLGYSKIVSPVDGIVIDRKVDTGQTVAASFQTPELFVIAPDMEQHMFVFASVDESDIGKIRSAKERGQSVLFAVDSYPGETFEGKIHQIRWNSTTTQNVVTYPVVIEVPNPGLKLLPGMTANITFQIETKEGVLRLPSTALRFAPLPSQVRQEDRHFIDTPTATSAAVEKKLGEERVEKAKNRRKRIIWVKEGELLRAVPVTLGLIENQFAELLDGDLTEGQEVVTGIDTGTPSR
ncbi:MAG: efflux RND transporter periplasmic adaptor subunit [Gemmataceae bacterium]